MNIIMLKKIAWVLCIIFAISIGLYAFTYFTPYANSGLRDHKSLDLLANKIWNFGFYTHISFAGIALCIGWVLFMNKLRIKRIGLHRAIGKVYVISALISGFSGLYIAYHATGGIVAKLGFSGMAIAWLIPTIMAYISIRNKEIKKHEKWMIRSYAVAFTGVTFRLWLPILNQGFELEFLEAYRIDSWLGWAPNLVFAEFLIRKKS